MCHGATALRAKPVRDARLPTPHAFELVQFVRPIALAYSAEPVSRMDKPGVSTSKTQVAMTYIGIDVSKDHLDLAWPHQKGFKQFRLANTETGFKQLLAQLPLEPHVVIEATGPYHLRLGLFLVQADVNVSVINPLVIKHFARMRLKRAKTDAADARLLADYGAGEQPALWQVPKPHMVELQQLQATLDHYIAERTRIRNQRHAFETSGRCSQVALASLNRLLEQVEAEITALEAEMGSLIEGHHKGLFARLKTIPGIGPKTALLLIVITDGFTRFDEVKQLVSYVGLAPRLYASGRRVSRHTPISKLGMGRIRCHLYLCARSAVRCNVYCRALYDRLRSRGKSHRLALVAVAHKLLRQCFAIARSGGVFDANLSINTAG